MCKNDLFCLEAIVTYENHKCKTRTTHQRTITIMIDELVDDQTNLPEWVESKITKAQDYMSAVLNYMKGEMADAQEEMMEEEKLTKPQIKDRDKRAKKIMKSTKKQYGKKEGEDIAYAIATNQVKEET